MKNINKTNGRMFLIALALMVLLGSGVSALSMPLSVSGTVFDLESGEQITESVHISINNTDSGYYVEGMTGTFYNPGRYSASVDGHSGDYVIITVWNEYHSDSIVVSLSGSLHGVDLYLNTSVPSLENHPPEIVSEPVTRAFARMLYRYDVDAVDPDGDNLVYSLLKKPRGMSIDEHTGVIEWVPRIWQRGKRKVSVIVEDGRNGTDVQNFTVRVRWFPWWGAEIPPFNITNVDFSSLFIRVIPFEPYLINNPEVVLKELLINNDVDVDEVYVLYGEAIRKPSGTRTAARKVYKYLQIYPLNVESDAIDNASVKFGVSKRWLDRKHVEKEDIKILRYVGGYWYPRQTVLIDEDLEHVYYSADLDGLGYFAIVERHVEEEETVETEFPYFVVGTVYESDGETQVEEGISVVIENSDKNERIELSTGIGPMSGAYAVVISGDRRDRITITVDEQSRYSFRLRDRENNIDFVRKRFGSGFRARVNRDGEIAEDLWDYLRGLFE